MPYIHDQEATRKNEEKWWRSHFDDYDMFMEAGSFLLLANTLVEKPVESLIGLFFIAAGVPAYAWWRRHPTPDSGEPS
jgi:hypothetical protein